MALHGYINTMNMCATNIDAMNIAGVYTAADVDNGTIVTLNGINKETTNNTIEGFEYNVSLATANPTAPVYVVASPEVGMTIEQQILSDPRNFYNLAGKAMSLKYLVKDVDCIEVTKECFTSGTLPANTSTVVTIDATGKFVDAVATAPSTANQAYFSIEGFHTVTIGMEEVPTVVLRFRRV